MHGILISRLGWCPYLLLGIVKIGYKNGYAGLLVLQLFPFLNP